MQVRFLGSGNSLSQRDTVPQQCRNFGSMYFGIFAFSVGNRGSSQENLLPGHIVRDG
jgi:hypothetical protein